MTHPHGNFELLGVQLLHAGDGRATTRLAVRPDHLAPNGYMHAAVVIALADMACGFGCAGSLPEGRTSFTTLELNANFVGTARDGIIEAVAELAHGGRTTQVWTATATREDGRTIALFRCTQLLIG